MFCFWKKNRGIIPYLNDFNTIEDINKKYSLVFVDTDNKTNKFILDVFNNKIDIDNVNINDLKEELSLIYFIFGLYYEYVRKDYSMMKENYILAIQNKSANAMHNLGHYYHYIEKDYENMKNYYLMAMENNYNHSMFEMGKYYKTIERNIDLSNHYNLMAFIHGNKRVESILDKDYNIFELYNKLFLVTNPSEIVIQKLNKLKNNKKRFLEIREIEIEYGIMISDGFEYIYPKLLEIFNDEYNITEDEPDMMVLHLIGSYYQYKIKNYEKMKLFYSISINKDCFYSCHNLGSYYERIEKNYELMKKNYLIAIEQKHIPSMIRLGLYYLDIENNKEEMKKYLLIGIMNEDIESLSVLIKYYKPLYIYYLLNSCENKNDLINKNLEVLRKSHEIRNYQNKIRLFERLNNIKECIVCFSDKLNINLECGHEVCNECYCNIAKCPYRCSNDDKFI